MLRKEFKTTLKILNKLIKNTLFENHVYAVGGCIRDWLSNREIKDIDLVVDIENGGIELAKYLERNNFTTGSVVIYEHYGTAMFHLKEIPNIELEAVQTRKESYRNMESRNPETAFGTIYDDSERRDFTYNALYYNISTNSIHDFNGNSIDDLVDNVLRTCGNPDIIFTEDPLRILRAIRFKTRFDSKISEDTFNGMKKYSERLSIISKERIQDEFNKIITCNNNEDAIKILMDINALKFIVSDIENPYLMLDRLGKNKSIGDITDLVINLAIVFNDSKNPELSLKNLKYSNDIINDVMFLYKHSKELDKLCKNIKTWGYTNINKSDVRKLQYICKSNDKLHQLLIFYNCINDKPFEISDICLLNDSIIKEGTSFFDYKLPINGDEIMEILNIEPGKRIKEILEYYQEMAFYKPSINKEYIIENLKKTNLA